jgi:hypothetical protein
MNDNMSMVELASYVCDALAKEDIHVVLSGGSCVEIYSRGDYTSYDLDLINRYNETFYKIKAVMEKLGFEEEGRYFVHEKTQYFIEFPSGPLGVGDEPVQNIEEITTKYGTLKLLTPTDCVKDRLAAYFHWNDEQSLTQAIWVASQNSIDLNNIEKWAVTEQSLEKFYDFKTSITNKRK